MKTEITRSSWDDLIFESRNKEYGAYCLRKSHNENVAKGFFVALLFGAFVFGVVQVAALLNVKIEIIPPTINGSIVTPPPVIIPDPPAKQEIKFQRKSNPDFFPVATAQQPIETPPVEPITPSTNPSSVGSETGTGEVPTGGNNQGIVEPTTVTVKPVEIFNGAEVMPEYEGGLNAMSRFLARKLNYPASARAMGQEGIVYVRFVVSSTGKVVDVEVIKGVSAILDREAMRVVSLMTKWKPGMQHDLPVNVRMVLPIRFHIEQQ